MDTEDQDWLDLDPERKYGGNEGESGLTITLRPKYERLVAEALRSGAYQTADEVVEQALEMLGERETWLAEGRSKIEEGYASAQRAEMIDGDQVRVNLQEKKRAWLAERHCD